MLVDAATRDDAAVFRLSDDRALVATTDFFTPIVDDPRALGRDRGGERAERRLRDGRDAALRAQPRGLAAGQAPLRGAGRGARRARPRWPSARAARCSAATRSTSLEPLFGLVVIGEVHPDRVLTNAGACAGDVLVLTKPLGTGILSTALKRDALIESGHGATRSAR